MAVVTKQQLTNLIKEVLKEFIEPADPSKVDPDQLRRGIEVEMEHTNNPQIAKRIALQHLAEDPQYYTKLDKAGLEEEEQTVDFDIVNTPAGQSVIAKYDGKVVGKLRLRKTAGNTEVDSVLVYPEYRGYGIAKEMYRLANEKLGPLYSDKYQTPDAKRVWSSFIKSGEAKDLGNGTYVMIKENIHDPVRPGILKRQIPGKITCTKAKTLKGKQKDKSNNTAKAAQRFLNYHCQD